jgi:hypothetical protein
VRLEPNLDFEERFAPDKDTIRDAFVNAYVPSS